MSQPSAAVLKDLAPTGRLRAAINQGNGVLVQRNPAGGKPAGITIELAEELGRRLGVPVELVLFDAAGEVFKALKEDKWDVAFLAIEPVRAAEIEFTPAYVLIEGAYMVRKDAPFQTPADVDKPGVRIAVGVNSAYDLFLTRTIKNAEIVRATTGGGRASIDLFFNDRLEVAAGVRQPLAAYAATDPDVRVLPERFMAINQAMGTPKGRLAGVAYLKEFIEERKASGFVADALQRTNQPDALVAPPAP